MELVLEQIPVEELHAGDRVRVSRRIGLRTVLDVHRYPTLGHEQAECFVVIYDPAGPGFAWENRARAEVGTSHYQRAEASLAPKRVGYLVEGERRAVA